MTIVGDTVISVSGCLFCAIVSGNAAAFVVAAEPDAVAFLDIRPVFKGHVLIAPRAHLPTLADVPPPALGGLFGFVQRAAVAVEQALGAGGTLVAVNNRVSQSVPHLHIHVVPRTRGDGLRGFFWPRTRYGSDAEAAGYAEKIATALAG